MKNLIPLHVNPIGTTKKLSVQDALQSPFSAYHKPRLPHKRSLTQRINKAEYDKQFATEKDFNQVNRTQQYLLMQELWLGKPKAVILQALFNKHIEAVTFVHWLAIPSLGVILSFSHQLCEKVEWL